MRNSCSPRASCDYNEQRVWLLGGFDYCVGRIRWISYRCKVNVYHLNYIKSSCGYSLAGEVAPALWRGFYRHRSQIRALTSFPMWLWQHSSKSTVPLIWRVQETRRWPVFPQSFCGEVLEVPTEMGRRLWTPCLVVLAGWFVAQRRASLHTSRARRHRQLQHSSRKRCCQGKAG